jgi:hypothetical protein
MKAFIVLGMHRSHTSLLAKGLNDNGVNMGKELLPATSDNPCGYYENIEFIRMNNKILKEAGGSWDCVPDKFEILRAGHKYKEEIEALIERSSCEPMWGWKDPRTTLTIECYLPFLKGQDVSFIVSFRCIKEVAKSLIKRGELDFNEACALAREYRSRLSNFLSVFLSIKWTSIMNRITVIIPYVRPNNIPPLIDVIQERSGLFEEQITIKARRDIDRNWLSKDGQGDGGQFSNGFDLLPWR